MGDHRAREQLFARLYDRVRTTVYYLASGHSGMEDFVQASMIEIFLSLGSFGALSSLEVWADRITLRTTMRLLKTDRRRHQTVSLEPVPLQIVSSRQENDLYCRQVLVRIAKILEKLSPRHRQALTLHLVLGYSIVEAAEMANVKVNTMRGRIKKARRKLLRLTKTDSILMERLHRGGE